MIFNNDELEQIKYIPAKMQRYMVDAIKNGDSDFTIEDPTNPFTMLLEANTISTLSALEENSSVARMLFPSLSKSKEELYHHISDDEEKYIFGSPSKTSITMMINVKDIVALGTYDPIKDRYKTTLPKYTEIIVNDYIFTIMNDINIFIQNNQSFVEQIVNDDIVIIDNFLGNIYSAIVVDDKNVEWVAFETNVTQLERARYEFPITLKNEFEQNIPINDSYYYSKVYIQNSDGSWSDVKVTHSPVIYNREEPTIHVEVLEDSVTYRVPDFYIIDGSMSGIIAIEIYTTKGKILLPLNKFSPNDFSIKMPKYVFTEEASSMLKINKYAFSRNIVDGGVSSRKTKDIRNKIIYNTTGTIDLPITEKQLFENARNNGFTLYKALDTITDRIYIAGKNINDVYKINNLPSNIDVFNNTVSFIPKYIDSENIVKEEDSILIKSNTIFISNNGHTEILNDVDVTAILNASKQDKISALYNDEYFFTPFYYVIDLDTDIINSRIYNLDNPELSYVSILNKNEYTEYNVNISKYAILKSNTGYDIYFSLYGNDKFKEIPKDNVYIQIGLDINELRQKIYFTAEYNLELDKYVAHIETNFMVDRDDRLTILNGLSNIYINKTYLDNEAEFIIYTDYIAIPRDDRYLPTLEIFNNTSDMNALCKQVGKLAFGKNLKYLWNKVNTVYTDRKYKKATNDIPLRYKEDVFSTDILNDTGYVIDTDYTDITNIKFLHKKGDIVLDSNGEIIYEYRIGDILKDENGVPIIDDYNGIIRYIDILMLPLEYKIVNDSRYNDYINDIKNLILKWTEEDMEYLNNIVLEHTMVYYKPIKSIISAIQTNDVVIKNIISPKVTLYVDNTIYKTDATYTSMISKIGKILHKYIEKRTIVLSDIKKDIIENVTNGILSVKITNITNNDDEIISLKNESNRLTIKRKITINNEVNYDINLNIIPV